MRTIETAVSLLQLSIKLRSVMKEMTMAGGGMCPLMAEGGMRPLMIDDGNRMLRFHPERCCLVRGDGNYCDIYAERGRAKPVCTLTYRIGKLGEVLRPWGYVRINRSELVNRECVCEIRGNMLTLLDGRELRITPAFREEVMAQFEVLTERR